MLPWCRETPQTGVCCLERLGRLKCLAIGLDASLSSFSLSRSLFWLLSCVVLFLVLIWFGFVCLRFVVLFFSLLFPVYLMGSHSGEEREAGLHFPSSPNNFTFFPWFPMNKFPFFLTFVASSRRQKIYPLLSLNNRVISFVSFSKEITMRSGFQTSREVLPFSALSFRPFW